jgi:transcriptional regulator with XRE-family HTH domain
MKNYKLIEARENAKRDDREELGYTQQEIADILGIGLSTYASKENGKSKFYIDEVEILMNVLGITIDIFLNKLS